MGLGDFPGRGFHSEAYGVSADGSAVVGYSTATDRDEAFRWTAGAGMIGLGDLPGGVFQSFAYGASADGSVVVGYSFPTLGVEAFRWTSDTGIVGLGDFAGGSYWSNAYGVSADGSAVAGYGQSASGWEAFRWTAGEGMVSLGDFTGGTFGSTAYGVSADGSIVVGQSKSASGQEAFRWVDLNGNGAVDPDERLDDHPEFGLGDLPGGSFSSTAFGVSADGSVVVGYSASDRGTEAFRWTAGEGMVGLGDLPGGGFWSVAYGVSADGSVVVGRSEVEGEEPGYPESDAFIWDEKNGMRRLHDVLVNDFGLDLTGWTLHWARGISADGSTIVGHGSSPNGYAEAWIAVMPVSLPALQPIGLIALGSLLVVLGVFAIGVVRWRRIR